MMSEIDLNHLRTAEGSSTFNMRMRNEAADEITRLRVALAEVRVHVAKLEAKLGDKPHSAFHMAYARAERAEADLAAAREVLGQIKQRVNGVSWLCASDIEKLG